MKVWVLVAILVTDAGLGKAPIGYFATESQCREAAEYILAKRKVVKGYFCLQGYEDT